MCPVMVPTIVLGPVSRTCRSPTFHDQSLFNTFVLKAILSANRMASFWDYVNAEETVAISAYLISLAEEALEVQATELQQHMQGQDQAFLGFNSSWQLITGNHAAILTSSPIAKSQPASRTTQCGRTCP